MASKQQMSSFWQFAATFWYNQLDSAEEGLSESKAKEPSSKYNHKRKISSTFGKDVMLLLGQFKSPLPLLNLCLMLSIVTAYILTADLLKVWFFKTIQNIVV